MNDKIKVKEKPKTITVKDKMEKVLNLIPVQSASDTIRSFCLQFEKCSKECPLYNARGKGCYFQNVVPTDWNIGDLIYERTELLSTTNTRRGRRKGGKNKDEEEHEN